MITNLVTGDSTRWPAPLQPIATYSPAIGAALLAAVGAKAWWDIAHHEVDRPRWSGSNPYPGLVSYTAEHAGVFFGRGQELTELVERVRLAHTVEGRFVPVIGPSGSGKSSLVLAGLLPALQSRNESRVLPVFTPGTAAVAELAGVIGVDLSMTAKQVLEAARAGDPAPRLDDIHAALAALRGGARTLVLIVDQLEEAVTQCVEDDRHAFLALLEAILCQEPRLRVVVTVRSDTVGAFQHGPGNGLFRDPLMVNVMGPREIRVVVSEPARLTATTFDDGLMEEIIRDAGGGDALPLLSYLLSDLYRNAPRDRHITWREYQNGGGVSGAITRQAQTAVRELGPDALGMCLDTLLLLVTLGPGGAMRQPVRASALSEPQLHAVRAFVDARLLISDRRGDAGDAVYTIAHEALLRQWQPLAEHILLHEESLRRLTELTPMARAWLRSGRQSDYLISGARLTDALAWARERQDVPPELREFLDRSERNQAGEMERRANRAAREALRHLPDAPETATAMAFAAYTDLAPTPLVAFALEASLADGVLRVLRYTGGINSLGFGSSGRLAIACDDGVVDRHGGSDLPDRVTLGQGAAAVVVAHGPRQTLVTGSADGSVRVWDADARVVHTRSGHDLRLHALCVAPDGRVVIGSADGSVQVLDHSLRPVLRRSEGVRHGPVYAVDADDSGRIAAGFGDGSVLVWTADGTVEDRKDAADAVFAVAFGPGGRLTAGGREGTVLVWDARVRAAHRSMAPGGIVRSLAYAPDGRLAAGFDSGVVAVWSDSGSLLHLLTDHAAPVSSVAFSPDGRLASGSRDGLVRLWDVDLRLATSVLEQTSVLAFTPDGTLLTGAPDTAHGQALALAVAADGRVACGHADRTATIWPPHGAGIEPQILTGHDNAVTAVTFAADGTPVTGDADGAVRTWAAEGSSAVHGAGPVFGLACATDGTTTAGCGEGLCTLTGEVEPLPAHASGVSAFAVAAADGRLAVGHLDGTVELQSARLAPGHLGPVRACAFAPDLRLATGSDDGSVRLWDADGQLLHTYSHDAPVRAVAFATDGRLAYLCGDVVRIRPHGTAPERLLALAARHPRTTLTPRQREAAMLGGE